MKKFLLTLFAASYSLFLLPLPAYASHAWDNYHWARTSNPFTLRLGDNLSTSWDPYLVTASTDWSVSSVLDTTIVRGKTSGSFCRATTGQVETCNYRYGKNGWLGLAQIWVSGDHITKGVVKVNDTYFNTPTYNKPTWKQMVVCQEVAHTFGLDHQDEDFNNLPLGTCMDYTSDPTPNQHPNRHDYDELQIIYTHLDAINTVAKSKSQPTSAQSLLPSDLGDTASSWGKLIRQHGKSSIFQLDGARGEKVFTFVISA